MKKLATPILVLVVLTVLLVGCGGGGKSSSGSTGTTVDTSKVNGITVGNCLNTSDFLVQPSLEVLEGQSPAGVDFTLTFYKSVTAAKAVIAKKNPKTTALVENGVIDFRGHASTTAGGAPAKISKVELAAIKDCMDKAKG
jgi:hypothetical protein